MGKKSNVEKKEGKNRNMNTHTCIVAYTPHTCTYIVHTHKHTTHTCTVYKTHTSLTGTHTHTNIHTQCTHKPQTPHTYIHTNVIQMHTYMYIQYTNKHTHNVTCSHKNTTLFCFCQSFIFFLFQNKQLCL